MMCSRSSWSASLILLCSRSSNIEVLTVWWNLGDWGGVATSYITFQSFNRIPWLPQLLCEGGAAPFLFHGMVLDILNFSCERIFSPTCFISVWIGKISEGVDSQAEFSPLKPCSHLTSFSDPSLLDFFLNFLRILKTSGQYYSGGFLSWSSSSFSCNAAIVAWWLSSCSTK